MTSAAIYVRVSTPAQATRVSDEDDDAGDSLSRQEERCRADAAAHGEDVDETHVYREVWSGVELWERPRLSALRLAIRDHAIDTLVVYESSRLSRDQDHLVYLFTEAKQAGVTIRFAAEDFDQSPTGVLVRYVSGWAAGWEHRRITTRTQDGRIARVTRAGKPLPGPRAKYGYQRDAGGDLSIDEPHATIVRRIYADSLAGVSVRRIAKDLTEAGVPSPTGKPAWTVGTVWEILHDEHYAGTFHAFTRTRYVPKSTVYERPQPVTLAVPAIVDRATYEAAQTGLTRNKRDSPRNLPKAMVDTYLLRGMTVCGYTGRRMTTVIVDGRYPTYTCQSRPGQPGECSTHRIAAGLLDDYVWEKIAGTLAEPERIAAHLRTLLEDDPTAEDVAPVEAAIMETERTLRHLADVIAEETIQSLRESHRAKYAALETQHERQRTEREALLSRRVAWQQAVAEIADLEAWCGAMREDLATMDQSERRRRLQQLQVEVHLSKGDGTRRKDGLERRVRITAAIPGFDQLLCAGSSRPSGTSRSSCRC